MWSLCRSLCYPNYLNTWEVIENTIAIATVIHLQLQVLTLYGEVCHLSLEFLYINWRASEVSETPSIATYRKQCCVYSTYVKTTMHMLTFLREAEEWMRVHL